MIPDNVLTIAGRTAAVSTLVAVLGLPEYADILALVQGATASAPLTVFAPTDAAFAAAGIDVPYVTDPANVDAVKDLLKYHLANANAFAGPIEAGKEVSVNTVADVNVLISKDDQGAVKVGLAGVAVGDVLGSNGVIHVIDAVLSKPNSIIDIVVNSPRHTRFVEILTSGKYDPIFNASRDATAQNPLTVFAPTNEAFAAAEAALGFDFAETDDADQQATVLATLGYHVVVGANKIDDLAALYNKATLNGEQIIVSITGTTYYVRGTTTDCQVTADLDAENGWVHVTNQVLLIPSTVADTAANTPDVSTLYAVLALDQYKDILDVVTGATPSNPLTVFAPTNAAFADAGITLEYVQVEENVAAVKEILKYHVAALNAFAGNLASGQRADIPTLVSGKNVVVSNRDGQVFVNEARAAAIDVLASNGAVHVIEEVLSPSNAPAPDDGLSGAATAAVVIGVIMAVLLLVGVGAGYYFYSNKNRSTVGLASESDPLTQAGP